MDGTLLSGIYDKGFWGVCQPPATPHVIIRIFLDIRIVTCYTDDDPIERRYPMKYSELERMLKKAGCMIDHEGKRHTMW